MHKLLILGSKYNHRKDVDAYFSNNTNYFSYIYHINRIIFRFDILELAIV